MGGAMSDNYRVFSQLKVGNRLKSVWWRNSAIYVAHCTNMKVCWGRWKNRIFQSTYNYTLYHIQYLVIVLKTREYIGEVVGVEMREEKNFISKNGDIDFILLFYTLSINLSIWRIFSHSHGQPAATQPGREEGGAALNIWYGWTGQPTNLVLSAVCATLQPAAWRHKLDLNL